MSSVPVTYGEASITPRGDYAHCNADYTCAQQWARYTPQEHELFARLYARQMALLPGRACEEFVRALPHLQARSSIPRFPPSRFIQRLPTSVCTSHTVITCRADIEQT